jgi:hypothetical protein
MSLLTPTSLPMYKHVLGCTGALGVNSVTQFIGCNIKIVAFDSHFLTYVQTFTWMYRGGALIRWE